MKKRRSIILLAVILLILIPGLFTGNALIRFLSDYLSKSEHVDANILLVEGWLPDDIILKASEEFKKNGYEHIFTTGINSSTPYFNVHSNGRLIFNTKEWFSRSDTPGPHIIEVDAYSELGGRGRAHFNLFINNSPARDFYVGKRKRKYRIRWTGNLKDIDSVAVQFDNDRLDEMGDRNLYVKGINADKKIDIPYLNNSVYEIVKSDGYFRMANNIKSRAESARVRLILTGIDSSLISAVPAKMVKINRTLTSALAFSEWLKTHNTDIRGINIITLGPHSRRTWMTYNKILKNRYNIGIISVNDDSIKYAWIRMVFTILRETLGLLYYRIILIPY